MVARFLGGLLSGGLFLLAALFIYKELQRYPIEYILLRMQEIPLAYDGLAFFLTVICYSLLTAYDFLALAYIQKPLGRAKTVLMSFIAHVFGNNIGFANLAASTVRLRFLSFWGVSVFSVVRVVAVQYAARWLGFFLVTGLVFLLFPPPLPEGWVISGLSLRALGVVFLLLFTVLSALAWKRKRSLHFRRWEIPIPSRRLLLWQVLVSALDWSLTGLVPFVLLLPFGKISYWDFWGIYLLAKAVAIVSHVPGGVGVFEGTLIALLGHLILPVQIMGSLLVYRVIYFLLPLTGGLLALGSHEIARAKKKGGTFVSPS